MLFTQHNTLLIPLLIGFLLDALIGDPQWLPHPIRFFGKIISFCDKKFNYPPRQKFKGLVVATTLVVFTFVSLFVIQKIFSQINYADYIFNSIMFFFAISNHSLISESFRVEKYLRNGDLEKARYYLSWIVGRDTQNLSAHKIRTATLETMSENLSDGVIAPMFFYLIGGIPLMFTYKMINTLDSMIGYKNDRYREFGWFSAKILDDAANFFPARLTAFFMFLCCPRKLVAKHIFTFARCHTSPNSGYPESALSGILNCQFGGPNTYKGKEVIKPYIGNNPRELSSKDFTIAASVNISSSIIALVISIIIILL